MKHAGIADIYALPESGPPPGFDDLFDLAVDPDCSGDRPCNVVDNGRRFVFARARLSQLAEQWADAAGLDAGQCATLTEWLDALPWRHDHIIFVWGLDEADAAGADAADGQPHRPGNGGNSNSDRRRLTAAAPVR